MSESDQKREESHARIITVSTKKKERKASRKLFSLFVFPEFVPDQNEVITKPVTIRMMPMILGMEQDSFRINTPASIPNGRLI